MGVLPVGKLNGVCRMPVYLNCMPPSKHSLVDLEKKHSLILRMQTAVCVEQPFDLPTGTLVELCSVLNIL